MIDIYSELKSMEY